MSSQFADRFAAVRRSGAVRRWLTAVDRALHLGQRPTANGELRTANRDLRTAAVLLLVAVSAAGQFHRAEQDRKISYWLLDPATHQFLISHDFTVTRPGQASVHSFVRKGSVVSPDSKMIDLDTGKPLSTHIVTGKSVNALGYYPEKVEDDMVVVQGDLEHPVAEGRSTRVRVIETYTDPAGYLMDGNQLVWKRTLGRPLNYVTLPAGWMLTSVNTPATIALDDQGRVKLRFVNTRNGDLAIEVRAKQRYASAH